MGKDKQRQWGFIRETKERALKDGIDMDTGICRTGLDEYLEIIFPGCIWIHNKAFGRHGGQKYYKRPDYRCDELRLIVEYDGVQHYQKPDVIQRDIKNQSLYESYGYNVVRIPYFIQLTKAAVKVLFNKTITEPLFPEEIPSMGLYGHNTPAYCCPAGIERMAKDFRRFPQQYAVNMKALKSINDELLSGAGVLEKTMKELDAE